MGTGDIALPTFKALIESDHEIVGLITQPDKPVGRKQVLTPPAIKVMAEENGIAVQQPERVKTPEALDALRALDADVIVVMAYGQILPQALIDMPPVAIINLHASLLPRHRGASCIQAAIADGDEETGITIMHVTQGLDEGDIILKHSTPIGAEETGGELHDRLAEMGPAALLEALELLTLPDAPRAPQDDAISSYAPKLLRHHGEIDWGRPAAELARLVRAYMPWPGTYSCFTDAKGRKKRLKIFPPVMVQPVQGEPGLTMVGDGELLICCGENALQISAVQPEGSKAMDAKSFLAGGQLTVGEKLQAEKTQ